MPRKQPVDCTRETAINQQIRVMTDLLGDSVEALTDLQTLMDTSKRVVCVDVRAAIELRLEDALALCRATVIFARRS